MQDRTIHVEGLTEECILQFVNSWNQPIAICWVDYEGKEVQYATLEPGHSTAQQTYTTHVWHIRAAEDSSLVGRYVGPDAAIYIMGIDRCDIQPLPVFQPCPSWGEWRTRATACRIPIQAYDCVGPAAVDIACKIVSSMLQGCPQDIRQRLIDARTCIGIIGCCQVTSDMPGHTYLKLSKGGRDLDSTTRGLGGSVGCPLTTCGEENLTMINDSRYPSENILVHELAHTVMKLGMTAEQQSAVQELYHNALAQCLYSPGCYALENADEYWAEGTQAWFHATVRTDVNGGINTRAALQQHDPGLAALMLQVYGDNPWMYTDDCPAPFKPCNSQSSHTAVGLKQYLPDYIPPATVTGSNLNGLQALKKHSTPVDQAITRLDSDIHSVEVRQYSTYMNLFTGSLPGYCQFDTNRNRPGASYVPQLGYAALDRTLQTLLACFPFMRTRTKHM